MTPSIWRRLTREERAALIARDNLPYFWNYPNV